MMYKLIDLARNKQSTEYSSQFEALERLFYLAKTQALCSEQSIHLSIVDERGRGLTDLKISQRGEKL